MCPGVTTGTLAILVAQPTDVVKVRMQAAGKKGQYKVKKSLKGDTRGGVQEISFRLPSHIPSIFSFEPPQKLVLEFSDNCLIIGVCLEHLI